MAGINADQLQDLFLIFAANEGRTEKVTLALTDTMYRKRLSTVKGVAGDRMSKAGFREFVRQCPGLLDGLSADSDYIFVQNMGMAAAVPELGRPASSKLSFELTFDRFMDALAHIGRLKYPGYSPEAATMAVLTNHVAPLYRARFGDSGGEAADGAGGHSSLMRSPSSRRVSSVVLTSSGFMSASAAAASAGPRIAVAVDSLGDSSAAMGGDGAVGLSSGASSVTGGASSTAGSAAGSGIKRRSSMRVGLVSTGSSRNVLVGAPPSSGGRGMSPRDAAAWSPASSGPHGEPRTGGESAPSAFAASLSPAFTPAGSTSLPPYTATVIDGPGNGAAPTLDQLASGDSDLTAGGGTGGAGALGSWPAPSPASSVSDVGSSGSGRFARGAGSPPPPPPRASTNALRTPTASSAASDGGMESGYGSSNGVAASASASEGSAATIASLRGVVEQLVATVEQLRGQVTQLRGENEVLTAALRALSGATAGGGLRRSPSGSERRGGGY